MSETITLLVNGRERQVTAKPDTPLLYVLRNDLGLTAAKYGCGVGQCGACNVIIDGDIAFSCTTSLKNAAGKTIVTLEGLGTADKPHPIQTAVIAEQAAQCGYCLSGIILSTKVLLDRNPNPDMAAIRVALQDNLCRCGSHSRVFRAVRRAARDLTR